MKTQKIIAVIILVTSSMLTALVCRDIAYPAILCMLGLLGLQRRFTWNIKPEKRIIKSLLLLVLTIMFALHYRYTSLPHRLAYAEAATFAWETIARYFLASMILVLFLGPPEQLPASLGLFHIAITISAGQILLLEDMDSVFRLSELFSVILVVLYAATSCKSIDKLIPEYIRRKSLWLVLGLTLVVTANCSWVMSTILYRHAELLNYLPVRLWRGNIVIERPTGGVSHMGFSKSGTLSSILTIKGNQDSTPVLSITCDNNPGYIRARAFDVYRQSRWLDLSNREVLFPEQSPFRMYFAGRTNHFRLSRRNPSETDYMIIRPEFRFSDVMFTPLGTLSLGAPLNLLMRDDDEIVYAKNIGSGQSYGIAYTKSVLRTPPNRTQTRRMLNVPTQLDPRVRQLANRIFAECNTTSKKIAAVTDYFKKNYTYSLGLSIPPGKDKLTHFLLEESTGYCEYFASGAAILLRMANVPTRYVTGFLVTEKDSQDEIWVARNMDAHAWVEAWDQERNQWTIVEATVGEDLTATATTEQSTDMEDIAGALLRQLRQAFYQYGFFGVLSWSYQTFGFVVGVLLPTSLLGCILFLILYRYNNRKKYKGQKQSRVTNPAFISLHKMLNRMDRRVKAAGQRRHLNETIHAFSQRLRARDSGEGLWARISNWYLEYANIRYCKKITSKQLHKLAQELRDSL
ncbi:MAG: transglutaminase domain-containing protein [Phycisphaerales bacterium]